RPTRTRAKRGRKTDRGPARARLRGTGAAPAAPGAGRATRPRTARGAVAADDLALRADARSDDAAPARGRSEVEGDPDPPRADGRAIHRRSRQPVGDRARLP